MLSPSLRNKVKEILQRVARGETVSLDERLYIHNLADRDQEVGSWLTRARRRQQNKKSNDSIEDLLNNLDLGSPDPQGFYKPDQEDLGEWFGGAPSWLGRS